MENSRIKFKETVKDYFTAEIKSVYVYTEEKEAAKRIIKESLKDTGADLIFFEYGIDCGLTSEDYEPLRILRSNKANIELSKSISFVFEYLNNIGSHFCVIIFDNIDKKIDEDYEFAQSISNGMDKSNKDMHFYFISSSPVVPKTINKKVFYLEFPIITKEEIKDKLEIKIKEDSSEIESEMVKDKFINALYGLTEKEIDSLIKLSLKDNKIDNDDIDIVNQMKKQIIKKSGLLEFVVSDERLENIGGFNSLKSWIRRKKEIVDRMEEAKRFGVDMPKGIMLFGMPGCGKSLSAKAIANIFGIPLLRLDMGLILGPYVGMSEENMRKAIIQAESISPCVLWIDEIEKALAGVGGSGGSAEVTTRIFGSLLTWMQEKKNMVFVVATSNDLNKMPAEFLRKGRFDEIFFVDFPDEKARREIVEIHLRKRRKDDWKEWLNKIDIEYIIRKTKDYAGSDVEAVISATVEDAFLKNRKYPDPDFIKGFLEDYIPLSESMKEKIKDIKDMCNKFNFKPVEEKEDSNGRKKR